MQRNEFRDNYSNITPNIYTYPILFNNFALFFHLKKDFNLLKMTNIAIFASGSGSNAENIISFFKHNTKISVSSVFCNNPDAFVIQRAQKLQLPCHIFGRKDLYEKDTVVKLLESYNTDWIVLAGFLWKIPPTLTQIYPSRIINIHPALLPKFGGKGMYGHHVHQAVIDAGETESGITIHYVNENYDEGNIIFQAKCKVEKHDTPESLAAKVHSLEYNHFPQVIEQIIARS